MHAEYYAVSRRCLCRLRSFGANVIYVNLSHYVISGQRRAPFAHVAAGLSDDYVRTPSLDVSQLQ